MIYKIMKKFYSLFTILIVAIFIVSCQDNVKQKELEIKEKELLLKEKELANIEKSQSETFVTDTLPYMEQSTETQSIHNSPAISKTKFGFMVFKCKIPKLKVLPSGENFMIINETENYASKVVEIPNYSVDEEYKLLDEGEYEMKHKFGTLKAQLQGEIMQRVRPYERGDELMRSAENIYEVIDRQIKIFDTYSEASKSRKNMGF